MNKLRLIQVSKSFGRRQVLESVCFALAQGEILGVFGANGCGKSTLLKILFGTLRADRIQLMLNGLELDPKTNISAQHIAYLPQDPFLPKHKKVRDVIPLFFESGTDQDRVFRAAFIEKIAARKVGTLSLGERRYLEVLLIAHLPHPFVMMDEPFSMVEPLYKDKLKKLFIHMKASKGLILTDHYYQDVLAVMDKGLVITDGIGRSCDTEEALLKSGYLKRR